MECHANGFIGGHSANLPPGSRCGRGHELDEPGNLDHFGANELGPAGGAKGVRSSESQRKFFLKARSEIKMALGLGQGSLILCTCSGTREPGAERATEFSLGKAPGNRRNRIKCACTLAVPLNIRPGVAPHSKFPSTLRGHDCLAEI